MTLVRLHCAANLLGSFGSYLFRPAWHSGVPQSRGTWLDTRIPYVILTPLLNSNTYGLFLTFQVPNDLGNKLYMYLKQRWVLGIGSTRVGSCNKGDRLTCLSYLVSWYEALISGLRGFLRYPTPGASFKASNSEVQVQPTASLAKRQGHVNPASRTSDRLKMELQPLRLLSPVQRNETT